MTQTATEKGSSRSREAVKKGMAQAWIELLAEDPAAVSALAVARARLPEGARLVRLRRLRLIEIEGPIPGVEAIARRMHASSWFYNPHKERCTVRGSERDPLPIDAGEESLLVMDRDGTRRGAAERWWRHETGRRVRIDEAVVWVLGFAGGAEARQLADALSVVRDRHHGLFVNPHAELHARAGDRPPVHWIRPSAAGRAS